MSAVRFLEDKMWYNGDELLAAYVRKHPLFKGYEQDSGILGIVIEQVCVHAPAFVTCTSTDCGQCGRHNSGYADAILKKRSAMSELKCRTWSSWSPLRSLC